MSRTRDTLYPEVGAGDYTRVDGTVAFYTRVGVLLRPDMTVLDFGAGAGDWTELPMSAFRRELRTLKGKARRVIGVDIDPAVTRNALVDEAHVIELGKPLPLADGSVDLIVADFVFEHVADAAWAATELDRVLKPGGWICARTPNRWGYIGIGARLVPNRWHVRFLSRLQPRRLPEGVFPTCYRMNTRSALRRLFDPARFRHCTYSMNNEPAYFGDSLFWWRLMLFVFRFLPPALEATLFVFIRKRPDPNAAGETAS